MLGMSMGLGVIPPLLMFLGTGRKNRYYYDSSRKALNFHLTIFPLFVVSGFLLSWFKYIILAMELLIIMYAMLRIATRKPYAYPAIPYIKDKAKRVEKRYSDVR